ncbi:MAG: hydantoinase B/oxoprolinase family protein, partial [Candidatus Aminicenantaceae bacterium]
MAGYDSIELELFKNLFVSISEEMGAVLERTALSPNIKERRDFSCALFNHRGET